ncbi:MAG TPA: nucleotidyltransferase [Armatimonadota bacterium]|nr:nucleotidyltransferase [Armatimonadota bacterium]
MPIALPERISRTFRQALWALNESHVPYVVGGAFALHYYTGIWRDTHDLDVYIERQNVRTAIDALSRARFRDYGEMAAGDREWIYHATKNRVFIDVIWQPPNHLSPVDESFYARGQDGAFLDVPVRFMPPDELIWAKIFTMNRHRCDWPDVFDLVRACPKTLDWQHLVKKLDEHWSVLLSFIVLFDWTYPGEKRCIPGEIRDELLDRKMRTPIVSDEPPREAILDPWIHSRPAAA